MRSAEDSNPLYRLGSDDDESWSRVLLDKRYGGGESPRDGITETVFYFSSDLTVETMSKISAEKT